MRRSPFALLSTLIAVSALSPLSPAVAQTQWKWTDKSGTHYSDLPPPPSVPDKDILQRPASARKPVVAASAALAPASDASAVDALAPKRVEPELEAKRRKAEQEEAARKKEADDKQAAARADNCNRAKTQLRTIDSGMRIARVNEKGEREILDDQQRADQAKRARDTIASDCK